LRRKTDSHEGVTISDAAAEIKSSASRRDGRLFRPLEPASRVLRIEDKGGVFRFKCELREAVVSFEAEPAETTQDQGSDGPWLPDLPLRPAAAIRDITQGPTERPPPKPAPNVFKRKGRFSPPPDHTPAPP